MRTEELNATYVKCAYPKFKNQAVATQQQWPLAGFSCARTYRQLSAARRRRASTALPPAHMNIEVVHDVNGYLKVTTQKNLIYL